MECRECRTFEARRNLPRLSAPATLTLAEMFWACTRSRPVIFFDQTAGALYDVFCFGGEDVFGCHQKARIFTENLLLIRRLASQRLQISPLCFAFQRDQRKRIKVISTPSGEIFNKVQRINQCFAKTGLNRWQKKKETVLSGKTALFIR